MATKLASSGVGVQAVVFILPSDLPVWYSSCHFVTICSLNNPLFFVTEENEDRRGWGVVRVSKLAGDRVGRQTPVW